MKAFASRRDDRFRPSYGRRVIRAPRQCILAGTTNADRYLKDESGARRFLPARCGTVDIDAIIRDRDQLWAQAVMLYRRGTPWWFTDTLLIKAASDEQDERYMEDAWSAAISEYVYSKDVTSIGEVLEHAIGLENKVSRPAGPEPRRRNRRNRDAGNAARRGAAGTGNMFTAG